MSANTRIYLSPPHIGSLEREFVKEAFDTNWISPVGPHLNAFENEMADYLGLSRGHALALSSGTAAIHLALRLANVAPSDHILCSSLTFAASAFPILYEGAIPVFVDSEETTWNICPSALERAVLTLKAEGKLPKALVAVSLYGQSFDADAVEGICRKHGIVLIEDAAEALGSSYQGKKCGSFGDFSILSFNGNKIITTSGGGMLLARDSAHIEKARKWSTQSREPAVAHYEHQELGFNYRLSNLLAGLGRGQLMQLDERVQARRRIFATYSDELSKLDGVSFMPEPDQSFSNRWLTVMRLDPRKIKATPLDIIAALDAANVEARPVWKPMHRQPIFSAYRHFTKGADLSVGDTLYAEGLCLPSGSALTQKEQSRVIDVIRGKIKS